MSTSEQYKAQSVKELKFVEAYIWKYTKGIIANINKAIKP